MSVYTSIRVAEVSAVDPERGHKVRLFIAYLLAAALIAGIVAYGWDYYRLSAADRPFSDKHMVLRPSGKIGVKLGILGASMFSLLFLYALRKKIGWLNRLGKASHWLDFHVVIGLSAPIVIAFHASFKFRGIAGMAFWIMVSVAISGVIGRYIYAQIPRSLSSAELSLRELETIEAEMTSQLAAQRLVSARDLQPLFRLPSRERVARESTLMVLTSMMWMDFIRPFKVARLRWRAMGFGELLVTFGGLLHSSHRDLEAVIATARRKASLAKRAIFLSRTQEIFHLWHVVHRPFSYSFAVLAILHITVALAFGYM